jgi:hypothetical protein
VPEATSTPEDIALLREIRDSLKKWFFNSSDGKTT